jgi:hypothetical protein
LIEWWRKLKRFIGRLHNQESTLILKKILDIISSARILAAIDWLPTLTSLDVLVVSSAQQELVLRVSAEPGAESIGH